ncbi:hypothetical protein [Spirosoma fluminis]
MIYPDLAVRTVVFAMLQQAGIAAFDSEAPVGAFAPYVLLLNQDSVDYSTKNGYGFIHKMLLSAVSVGPSGSGREQAEILLNETLTVLIGDKPNAPVKIDLSGFPFKCWMVKPSAPKDLTFTGETESVYQKLVTLELSIDAILP